MAGRKFVMDYLDAHGAVDNGEKTVTAAGTPESLVASSLECVGILVRAKSANADVIYVGKENSPTFPLAAGEAVELKLDDLQG